MAPKSESDHIVFLLAIVAQSKETDWNGIAESTGLYKSGKFVKQAYDNLKKKYVVAADVQPTPKSTKAAGSTKKKRANIEVAGEEEPTPSKKARMKKTEAEGVKEEDEEELLKLVDSD